MKTAPYSRLCICIFVIVLLASACSGQSSNPQSAADYPFANVVITLERTVCHGTCPAYKLTISGNGLMIYEGINFVEVKGGQTAMLSPDQIQALVSAFQQIDYFSLQDYVDESITDAPSAITSISINDETKSVNHYYGDSAAPQSLFELESTIDQIVNSQQWTGK